MDWIKTWIGLKHGSDKNMDRIKTWIGLKHGSD
jgi:hypothetical protein